MSSNTKYRENHVNIIKNIVSNKNKKNNDNIIKRNLNLYKSNDKKYIDINKIMKLIIGIRNCFEKNNDIVQTK